MSKLLIPVDGSPSALAAVRYAIRHGAGHNLGIHLVNVQPLLPQRVARFVAKRVIDEDRFDRSEQALQSARELLDAANLPYTVHRLVGDSADTIAQLAERGRFDAILVGTRRKNPLTKLVEGSLTERLLTRANCPVEVIVEGEESKIERYGIPAGLGAGLTLLYLAAQ